MRPRDIALDPTFLTGLIFHFHSGQSLSEYMKINAELPSWKKIVKSSREDVLKIP
jgi:hypothetical protein